MNNLSNARQRILALLDDNSFVEIGAMITSRATNFNMRPVQQPSDGVITGYGVINGGLVYVYSQDMSVLGGTVGEMHAAKICNLYEMAIRTGAPVIGLIESAGVRLEEGTDALHAFSLLYRQKVRASGLIPQISAIFGQCGGGLAMLPAMSDFTFMEENAKLFVNAPNTLKNNEESRNDTSAAHVRAKAGNVDFTGTTSEIITKIRDLISLLPANNEDEAFYNCEDDLNRGCSGLEELIADPAAAMEEIGDDHYFMETGREYAPEMVTGFLRLNGSTAGIVANRSRCSACGRTFEKALTAEGCRKAAKFINFCDSFEIPVISFSDVTGFAAVEEEEMHVAEAAGKMAAAFADASVPKISVLTGITGGSAYTVMNSRGLGADFVYAFPEARIEIMPADAAAKILAAGQGADAYDRAREEFDSLQNSIAAAASRGYIDQIVEPSDIRKYLISGMEVLYSKRELRDFKKHGTI